MRKILNNCINKSYFINTIKPYKIILKKYQPVLNDLKNSKKMATYFHLDNTVWTHYNVLISYMKWAKDNRYLKIEKIKLPRPRYLKVYVYF